MGKPPIARRACRTPMFPQSAQSPKSGCSTGSHDSVEKGVFISSATPSNGIQSFANRDDELRETNVAIDARQAGATTVLPHSRLQTAIQNEVFWRNE